MSFEIVNMISGVFTAIGTTGAVIISLWLIYRSNKINAIASIDVYSPNIQKNNTFSRLRNEKVLRVSVSNIGIKPFSIKNFVIKDFKVKNIHIASPDYSHPECTKTNFIYEEGASGIYIFSLMTFTESALKILKIAPNEVCTKKHISKIKMYITTNLGQHFKVRCDKEVVKLFLESANKINCNRKK